MLAYRFRPNPLVRRHCEVLNDLMICFRKLLTNKRKTYCFLRTTHGGLTTDLGCVGNNCSLVVEYGHYIIHVGSNLDLDLDPRFELQEAVCFYLPVAGLCLLTPEVQ